MKGINMRDIGKAVGVSAVTVSNALSGKPGVSEETRRTITRVAQEMGYTPGPGPQERAGRSLDVGILVPDRYFSADAYYAMLYRRLVKALSDAGHFGLLELLPEESQRSLTLPNLMRTRRPDGLILLGQPGRAYARMIAAEGMPTVFLDFYDENAEADSVVGDDAYGCYRLTSHLIRGGHRNIGFVGSVLSTSSIMDRYLGFYRAMIANGLPIRPEWVIGDRDDRGVVGFRLPAQLPTALVCNCDVVARKVLEALNERGLRVPQDVSIVGFDDYSAEAPGQLGLSTFRVDWDAMTRLAVKLLEERCAGVSKPHGRTVIGGQPIYRESEGALTPEGGNEA